MFQNYLRIAIRNLLKQKFYSVINILGLSVGIAATLFIMLYINDELSYDRFHAQIDQMYRLGLNGRLAGQEVQVVSTPPPMAAVITDEIPGVTQSIRLWEWNDVVVKYEDKAFTDDKIFHTDSNFFKFFSFELLQGDASTALQEPNSMVITESIAQKFFGNEERLGRIITFSNDNKAMKVTGVVADPPQNSHFKFNYLISFSSNDFGKSDQWLSNSLNTYFMLGEGADIDQVMHTLNSSIIPKYVGPQIQQFMGISLEQFIKQDGAYGYSVIPVKDIHLHSHLQGELEPPGDVTYVYILGAIGLFILMIAAINFMNLSTARSSGRAREVGMRKTLGSLKHQLVFQFLLESMVFSIIAVILAAGLVVLLLPQFNTVSGKLFTLDQLLEPTMVAGTLGVGILIGLLAGSYPAFYLTRFKITDVFKGSTTKGTRSGLVRGGLVVVQFAISILLIICTAVVYQQLQYTQNKNLGFNKDKVLVVSNSDRLDTNRKAFKDALLNESNITAASYSNSVIPGVNNTTIFRKPEAAEDHIIGVYYADHDQFDVMGFELVAGRNFSRDFPSDSTAMLVNEAIVREMDWKEPIGEKLLSFDGDKPVEITVIGVLKDYNFESLRDNIRPIMIRLGNFGNDMTIRYTHADDREAVKLIERIWKSVAPNEPFEYNFLNERFDELYRTEQRVGLVFSIFTSLAIIISCLGLFGLAAYTAEQRTKEIGIRKVMGASSFNIVKLINTEFIKYIFIAYIISLYPAYYLISAWLDNFVYRIDLTLWIFLFSGTLALFIALVTVSIQSVKASQLNPADTLRYE
ncbi:MAG: FtsX-like permease family protein [Cyclobacteriaceae bacterium]|nr:FtsX-like permease family protein [Cyclobacteriaceae bacterium]